MQTKLGKNIVAGDRIILADGSIRTVKKVCPGMISRTKMLVWSGQVFDEWANVPLDKMVGISN